MIVSISSAAEFYKPLRYNFAKVEKGHASVIDTNALRTDPDGNISQGEALRQLNEQIPSKRRARYIALHASINPGPGDNFSDERIAEIARDYMERMGYAGQPYVLFKHHDIDRVHYHIVASRIRPDGSKVSDAYEFQRSASIVSQIERDYGMKRCYHGQAEEKAQRAENDNRAKALRDVLGETMKRYAFQSVGELNAILQRHGIRAKETRKQAKGKRYNGIIYCFIDAEGREVGVPIRANDLGKGYGYRAMQEAYGRARAVVEQRLPQLRQRFERALDGEKKTRSEQDMRDALAREGVEMVIRRNAQGRIIGVTFVCEELGVVVNGSRLGKEFAANAINARLQPDAQQRAQQEQGPREETPRDPQELGSTGEMEHHAQHALEGLLAQDYRAIQSMRRDAAQIAKNERARRKPPRKR